MATPIQRRSRISSRTSPRDPASPSNVVSMRPPAKVYAAWADPQKIIHWFGPSRVVAGSVRAELDVRTRRAAFRVSFTSDDGEYHEVGGIYREVISKRETGFQLGVAFDAGAGVAGDGIAAAGRRRDRC